MPLVLADTAFMTRLADVEKQIGELKVKDAVSAQTAATLLSELTKTGKALDDERLKLKRPFAAIEKQIDAVAAIPQARIEQNKRLLKTALTDYAELERVRLAEEERKRQAELARLRAEQVKQEAEAAAAAAELLKKSEAPAESIDFADELPPPPKTEIEKKIEAVQFAPARIIARPIGITFKVRLVPTVYDVSKLPEAFVIRTADEQKIRSVYCTGWQEGAPLPDLPGVKFIIDRQPVSTGR